jgi:hypothetical protein
MTLTYEEITTENNELILRINEDATRSFIPKDLANSDYQRYLNPEADQPIGGNI